MLGGTGFGHQQWQYIPLEESFGRRPKARLPRQGQIETRGRRNPAIAAREYHSAPGARHLKKSIGHLLEGTEMKYRFIQDHRTLFPLERVAKVLQVSRSGYYAWLGRPCSRRAQ